MGIVDLQIDKDDQLGEGQYIVNSGCLVCLQHESNTLAGQPFYEGTSS